MRIRQLSVFIENASGRLTEIAELLGEAGVSIRALSLADGPDFGILRLVVSDPDRARRVLHEAQFTVHEMEVLAMLVEDAPGGLGRALRTLSERGINVEYMYTTLTPRTGRAVLILRPDGEGSSVEALSAAGIELLSEEDVRSL
jgi:hypothetical protein